VAVQTTLTARSSPAGGWENNSHAEKGEHMTGHDDASPRIVAGVDGSPSSLAALRWAVRQAGLTGATVDAVIAWHYPVLPAPVGPAPVAVIDPAEFEKDADRTVTDAIRAVTEPGSDVQVSAQVKEGNPAQALLDAADGADLLVVGSRGHGGFAEALLGSVGQHCVHHAPCPVAIIRDKKGQIPDAGR
jgi:nucleotide-binding universal stress UspA family protein